MLGYMAPIESYVEPTPLGGIIPGQSVAQVITSNDSRFTPGNLVAGYGGWQAYWSRPGESVRLLDAKDHPLSWNLRLMGMPGIYINL